MGMKCANSVCPSSTGNLLPEATCDGASQCVRRRPAIDFTDFTPCANSHWRQWDSSSRHVLRATGGKGILLHAMCTKPLAAVGVFTPCAGGHGRPQRSLCVRGHMELATTFRERKTAKLMLRSSRFSMSRIPFGITSCSGIRIQRSKSHWRPHGNI